LIAKRLQSGNMIKHPITAMELTMTSPEERLEKMNISLGEPAAAVANYVPYTASGRHLFISGQISMGPDGLVKGRLGENMSLEEGQAAAKLCGINLITQMKAALGSLSRVVKIVKLGGFVNCTPDFEEIPHVINGCSDLMVDVFGETGRHARSAVACPVLPLGVAVEIDAIVEFE
jgi:enamine deaminase RidA (YjgF/YER057c/UK114 family)